MAVPTMIDEETIIGRDGNAEKLVTNYWSCPIKFIPDSVLYFLQCRLFYERHPSSPYPAMEEISPRYSQAETIFENELLSH